MRIDAETLGMRISRLERMVAETAVPENASEDAKHILRTAPRVLGDIKAVLQAGDPLAAPKLPEVLKQAETWIQWAVGTVNAVVTEKAIKSGKGADPSFSADQRLMNRIMQFALTKIDGPSYLVLIREFAGEDSVQGNTVYMDPGEETEAFSQWFMHDIVLPGESLRLIDSFAKAELGKLLADEQAILRSRLMDRPSIYKVVEFTKDPETGERLGAYLVQDLLSPGEVLLIRDKSTSRSLDKGAIFIGRAIPVDGEDGVHCPMGAVLELPPKLWSLLSGSINKWRRKYSQKNVKVGAQSFFRTHHARLRGKIRAIQSGHSRY